MVKDALLEIGTEEIPSSYIEPAREQLFVITESFLKEYGLTYKQIRTYATPRRLTLIIEGLEEKSKDKIEQIIGPSVNVGRDSNGNFTSAAIGFANRHMISPEKLEIIKNDKGEYFCIKKTIPGIKSQILLKEIFPNIISRISFPKTMIWESSCFRFARPIRVIVSLYGDSIIKFEIAGVKSGKQTFGLYNKKIIIKSPDKYLNILRDNCIIVDPQERKQIIRKIIETTAKQENCTPLIEEDLLNEVNYLVEHPVAIVGRFEMRFLTLPQEVLITCMKKKQKFFPLLDSKGCLKNLFIGIRNGVSQNQDIVREGYERVLTARLSDAEFFFHQDTRVPLSSRIEKLKGVIFQERLGTLYDKVERIKNLSLYLYKFIQDKSVTEKDLIRAAELSKADLVTEMVFEYPELQGIMGRIYANYDKEPEHISTAIEEHYMPISGDSALPKTTIGVLLSLSDKIDTLVGNFAIGYIPTGSQDPYGLRRISTGIIRIILEKKIRISLLDIINKSFSLISSMVESKDTISVVLEFMKQRIENLFISKGFRFDEVRAIMASKWDDILDINERLIALKDFKLHSDFDSLITTFKRISNILKQAEKLKINFENHILKKELFQKEEVDLYSKLINIENELKVLYDNRDYIKFFDKMLDIKPEIDKFFDKVLVMVDDENIRNNRLTLLNYTKQIFFKILDFSLLQQ